MAESDVRAGRCAHCGAYFEWVSNGPEQFIRLYCKPTHASSAARKARNIRESYPAGYCPTPDKRKFLTGEDASIAVREQWPLVQGARPYLCSCGKFHIGRLPKRNG